MPRASALSTTPSTTWFTRNLTAKTASSRPIRAPPTSANAIPTPRLCATVAASAAQNAPTSICPSMATLMTPVRSHRMPAIAPRISGTDRKTVCCSIPTTSIALPLVPVAAQHRNASTNSSTAAVTTHGICRRVKPRASCHAPSRTTIAPSTIATVPPGNCRFGMVTFCPGWEKPNSASPGSAPTPQANTAARPASSMVMPVPRRRRREILPMTSRWTTSSSASSTPTAGAVIRSIPSPAGGYRHARPLAGRST